MRLPSLALRCQHFVVLCKLEQHYQNYLYLLLLLAVYLRLDSLRSHHSRVSRPLLCQESGIEKGAD